MSSLEARADKNPAGKDIDRQEQCRPLEVIIIGAGISGLSLGIYLRQNGHRVKIFEQSKFARELGAAVHIPPNAHGLVKRMGINPAANGANEVEHVRNRSLPHSSRPEGLTWRLDRRVFGRR